MVNTRANDYVPGTSSVRPDGRTELPHSGSSPPVVPQPAVSSDQMPPFPGGPPGGATGMLHFMDMMSSWMEWMKQNGGGRESQAASPATPVVMSTPHVPTMQPSMPAPSAVPPATTVQPTMPAPSAPMVSLGDRPTVSPTTVRKECSLDQFLRLRLPEFYGTTDPLAAQIWLRRLEKNFTSLGCSDEEKVRFTLHLFQGEADDWWETQQRAMGVSDLCQISWAQFRNAFYDRYFPDTFRHQKRTEFYALTQQGSVLEYEQRFTTLAKFVPQVVADEKARISHFSQGLRSEIRPHVSPSMQATYALALARALEVEAAMAPPSAQQGMKRNRDDYLSKKGSNSYDGGRTGNAMIRNAGNQSRRCHQCGALDHFKRDCPQLHQQLETQQIQGIQQQGPRRCYTCGSPHHFAAACPSKQGDQTFRPQQQSGPGFGRGRPPQNRDQQRPQYGAGNQRRTDETQGATARVYAMTREEVRATPNVITGTLSLNDRNLNVPMIFELRALPFR